ncbi:MAG: RNA 2',3'-cyclic phosphodiesterase [Methanothrix sp.]|nr:RNA 2',3'-cyclic phosphodiesterase [Methanothrix sp.]
MRCFVAVELPLPMREEMGRLQSRIATDGLRLVRAELVHVTMKFLGDVPQEKVGAVAEALGRVKAAPFLVRVKGMGAFPGRAVRVVWLGLEGDFQELFQKIEQALSPLGFAPEARGFSPHVTLGRVARPGAEMNLRLGAKIANFSGLDLGSFTVDRFYLKKSTLTRGGPIYEDLAGFPL